MTEVVHADPERAAPEDLQAAVEVLLDGGVCAGPTETFYALMAAVNQPEALDRILRLKGRGYDQPLLLLIDQAERVPCYAREIPEGAFGLMEDFWPGPLTMLFRSRPHLHPSLVGSTRTVGLRAAGLPLVRLLVRLLDRAVTGTSANVSGRNPPRTADEVRDHFGDGLDLIIDAGPTPGGRPSTIIDVSLGPPRLLRDGGLSIDDLMAAAPDLRT